MKKIDFKGVATVCMILVMVLCVAVGCCKDDECDKASSKTTPDDSQKNLMTYFAKDTTVTLASGYEEYVYAHDIFYFKYLWNQNIPNTFTEEYYSKFSSPEDMIESFIVSKDDKSWGMSKDEYYEQYNTFNDADDGIKWHVHYIDNSKKNPCIIVTYVVENSPAEFAGLHRGCAITKINGTKLTTNNYSNLMDKETKTVTYVETRMDDEGNLYFTDEEKTTPSFSNRVLDWNTILLKKRIETNNSNIGYLAMMYVDNEKEIDDAFQDLKMWDIEYLVLDWRFLTATDFEKLRNFVSYLVPDEAIEKTFLTVKYSSYTKKYNFEDRDSRLNLKRIYLLVSEDSNIHSLVSSLSPYIDITIIGSDVTEIKHQYGGLEYEGSNFVFRVTVSEWLDADGDVITTPAIDYNIEDFACTELGDPSEPLLAKALELINK